MMPTKNAAQRKRSKMLQARFPKLLQAPIMPQKILHESTVPKMLYIPRNAAVPYDAQNKALLMAKNAA